MLKELKEKCYQQLKEHDSCDGCPHIHQCIAFNNLRSQIVGRGLAHFEPWQLTDGFVERFDELIAKMGGEQNE